VADLFDCPVCEKSFRDEAADHWRCQWIMHPDDMIRRFNARCVGMPEQERLRNQSHLSELLFGQSSRDPNRPGRFDAPDAVGERAVLERLENEWWKDTGKPALDAAFPSY